MATVEDRLDNLGAALQQIGQQFAALKTLQAEHGKSLQQTRNALEKLAALDELEFIEELNGWVNKKKWEEFKKNPR